MNQRDTLPIYLSPHEAWRRPVIFEPGSLVMERYEVVAPLAAGARGTAHRARCIHSDRLVALKVDDWGPWCPSAERRFRDWYSAWRGIPPHRRLVMLLDAALLPARGRAQLFVAWELVEGMNLTEVDVNPRIVWTVAAQICEALEHLHRRGHVHGDVHLGNILFAGDDSIKLCDPAGPHGGESAKQPSDDVTAVGDVLEQLIRGLDGSLRDSVAPLLEIVAACRPKGTTRGPTDAIALMGHVDAARQRLDRDLREHARTAGHLRQRGRSGAALAIYKRLAALDPTAAVYSDAIGEIETESAAVAAACADLAATAAAMPLADLLMHLRALRRRFRDHADVLALRIAAVERARAYQAERRTQRVFHGAGDLGAAFRLFRRLNDQSDNLSSSA